VSSLREWAATTSPTTLELSLTSAILDALEVFFGMLGPSEIGDLAWRDCDRDGVHDDIELGMEAIGSWLASGRALWSTTLTDGVGR
jgi:hypothetical protein